MNFFKFQKITSIIPYYSTYFIFIVTMVSFVRYKASSKYWLQFIAIFFASGICSSVLLNVLLASQSVFVQTLAVGVMFAVVNFRLVNLQIAVRETGSCA